MDRTKENKTENFTRRIGNTTYKVLVHFSEDKGRTFSDSVRTLIMNDCLANKK